MTQEVLPVSSVSTILSVELFLSSSNHLARLLLLFFFFNLALDLITPERFTPWQIMISLMTALYGVRHWDTLLGLHR